MVSSFMLKVSPDGAFRCIKGASQNLIVFFLKLVQSLKTHELFQYFCKVKIWYEKVTFYKPQIF